MQKQIELLRRKKQQLNPNMSSNKSSLFGPAKPREIREIISNCEIVSMTCSGVGILESSFKFPFILIDEASQITEPNILISLVRITDQIVLVGDQKQVSLSFSMNYLCQEIDQDSQEYIAWRLSFGTHQSSAG